MNLVYICDDFYWKSGTMMSSIYTEDGKRSDWGFVQVALRNGEAVSIRQATEREKAAYTERLNKFLENRE